MVSWPPTWDRIQCPGTREEADQAIKEAHENWRAMLKKVARLKSGAGVSKAKGVIHRLGRSHTPIIAEFDRVVHELGFEQRIDPVLRVATAMALAGAHEFPNEAELVRRKKRNGQPRLTYKFSPEAKALQRVYARALRASAKLDPRQYLFNGGVVGCSEALISSLETHRWAWACEVDIKDYFDNLDFQDVEGMVPVSRPVQERVLFNTGYRLPGRTSLMFDAIMPAEDPGVPTGAPQGSACSSILSEIALSPYLAAVLPEGCPADGLNYADNFTFLAQTQDEVQSCVNALIAELRRRTGGRLRLGHAGVPKRTSEGFEFLGIHYRLTEGGVHIRAKTDRLEYLEFEASVYANFAQLGLDPERDVAKLRQRANGLRGSYRFVPSVVARVDDVLNLLDR